MTDENDDGRELGVEFGDLGDELDAYGYPASLDEILDEFGDEEIEMENNRATLEELIGPMGDAEFHDAQEVREAVLTMVGTEAIGRDRYSDRGVETEHEGEDETDPGQSF